MQPLVSSIWKLILLRGVLTLLFGLLATFLPGITFSTMILWLGAWLAINGLLMIISFVRERNSDKQWWVGALAGLAGILLGIYTFLRPTVTGAAIVIYLAIWSMILGIAEIIFAIRIRKDIRGEGWLVAGGLMSVVFGILLLLNPIQGGITLTLLLGIYALIFGIFLVILALRVKKLPNKL